MAYLRLGVACGALAAGWLFYSALAAKQDWHNHIGADREDR